MDLDTVQDLIGYVLVALGHPCPPRCLHILCGTLGG